MVTEPLLNARGIKRARKIRCAFREGDDVVKTQLGLTANKTQYLQH